MYFDPIYVRTYLYPMDLGRIDFDPMVVGPMDLDHMDLDPMDLDPMDSDPMHLSLWI